MKSNEHYSVLLNEAIQGLNIKSDGIYLDATLGRAGHSKVILKNLKEGRLVGIDQDDEALFYSKNALKEISNNFVVIKSNFKDLDKVLDSLNITKVDAERTFDGFLDVICETLGELMESCLI